MQSFVKKHGKGNIAVTLAYAPSPELTFIDMDVPHIVPLYADFDINEVMGTVRLVPNEDGIYAMFELTTSVRMRFRDILRRGEIPGVVFALTGGERMTKNGVNFVRGGTITAATLHDRIVKKSEEVANEHT